MTSAPASSPTAQACAQRIANLRAAMARHGCAACLVPTSDPHLSEYLPDRWASREWLSGFTGSAGTLIVTQDEAGVWVDSRYWVQAEAQLEGSGIAMMKIGASGSTAHLDWLAGHLNAGDTLAVDGDVLGLAAARALGECLAKCNATLRLDLDLPGEIWPDRPALPAAPVVEHALEYACRSRADKLAEVREAMHGHGAAWHLVSSLDDVAWIFNLRGADVPYNPVFLAHALIGLDRAWLFAAPEKFAANLRARLAADGVEVLPYEDIKSRLAGLPGAATPVAGSQATSPAASAAAEGPAILIDPRRVTRGLVDALPAGLRRAEAINPSVFAKSRKSAAEVAHVRRATEKDGAALCEFFAWFEEQVGAGQLTEIDIDTKLLETRGRQPGFVSPSFPTIAGFNANGAMPHYRALPEAHARIAGDGLLLIDSGGQYLDGTTDITRVVPVGTVSAAQKRDFTLVLKGMLALSRMRFPRGTRAPMLDATARAPLWAAGLDYGHGTGHGVGFFLNVHEGPQSISCHADPAPHTAMEAGMITSNEPGIYRPGQWGVRIENLLLTRLATGLDSEAEYGPFLEFEALTLCPIDTRCIDRALLRDDEADWLNRYHQEVRERLAPRLSGAALAWLKARTTPI